MNVVQLVLAAEHGADPSPLAEALGAETIACARLPEALASDPSLRAVILAPRFSVPGLQSGDPGAALSSWVDAAETVLAIQKQHRRACVVLLADEAAAAPQAAANWIRAWIGDKPGPAPAPAPQRDSGALEVIDALAAQALTAADPRARRTAAELRAAAAPVLEPADLSASAAHSRAVASVRQLKAGLDNAAQNFAELAREAQQAEARQAELESALAAAAQNYADAQSEIESLSQALEAARTAADETRDERDKALEDRKRASRDCRSLQGQVDRQSQEIALLQEMTRHLEAALEETHASTSWRLTAPIRAVKTALARNEADGGRDE